MRKIIEIKNAAYIREKFSDVNDRQINDIASLTGIDVTGYKNGINKNGFNHIEKRHVINGEADQTMVDTNDVARIPWVLENYDKAEAVLDNGQQVYISSSMDKNNYPAPLIKFSKAIDGTVYVVEAVPDSKYKTLWVETAYINKNRKSLVRATDAFAPSSTPKASHTAELSDEILLRENENVNIEAERPGFSDGQNSLDYSALQNITNTLYGKPDAENKDIYAPFYPKDNRPEGNTVGAKQSTTPFWTKGVQYGTYEPKARQTYEGNELFEAPKRLSNDGKQEVSEAVQSVAASPIGTTETLDYMIQNITGNAQTDASISEVMQDIVAAVKNIMPHKANSEVNVQTQQKASSEEALEQVANIPT